MNTKAEARTSIIDGVLNRAATSLRSDLESFWPAFGNNEMAEANVIVHLAVSFREAGFSIFSEVALEPSDGTRTGGTSARLDLLALRDGWMVGVEAKRLYNAQQAGRMAADWRRFDTHRPTTEYGNPRCDSLTRCVVATTWEQRLRTKWLALSDLPREAGEWGDLRDCIAHSKATRVSHDLLQVTDTRTRQQVLLAAFEHDVPLRV